MRKAVFTMNIGDYEPEVRKITYPLMRHWAAKIGAEFHEITERKFPDWPIVYEKLQLHQLARDGEYEWVIFYDADTLVFPDTPDWTAMVPKDTVACYGFDWAPIRWKMDEYFLRDGRMLGTSGWFTMASHLCLDLWRPSDDLTPEEVAARCSPTVKEWKLGFRQGHFADDFVVSRNVARFGLKAVAIMELAKRYNQEGYWYAHNYEVPTTQKADWMKMVLGGGQISVNGEAKVYPGWGVRVEMLRGGPFNGGWVPTLMERAPSSVDPVEESKRVAREAANRGEPITGAGLSSNSRDEGGR